MAGHSPVKTRWRDAIGVTAIPTHRQQWPSGQSEGMERDTWWHWSLQQIPAQALGVPCEASAPDREWTKWLPLAAVGVMFFFFGFFFQQKGVLITLRSSLMADLVTVAGSQRLTGCFLLIV